MMIFTVHEPPNPPADRIDRAVGMAFVRDGFSWSAALFTPIWMLAHRLWWPLLAYVAATGTIELVRHSIALNPGWLALATLALGLLIGLEAGTLRRWSLTRRGWTTLGTASGRTQEECERRFFDAWLASAQPQPKPPAPSGDLPMAGALSTAPS